MLLVTTPVNVRYLTGFTGTNGLALIYADKATAHRFLTDFRYTDPVGCAGAGHVRP